MRRYLRLLFVFALCLSARTVFAGNVKWSIVLYAATAEVELAKYVDPILSELMNSDLPPNTEMLIQYDTFGAKSAKRVVKRHQGHHKNEVKMLPKQDSASPEVFSDFLQWVNRTAQGEKKLLMVLTHSWGWQGIILNSDFPNDPDRENIMPIRMFGDLIEKAPVKFDVIFLDACIDGNAEIIEDLKRTTQYLVLSQRETPYCSFSFKSLFQIFAGSPDISPIELARIMPIEYVKAYSREGSMAKKEGEYDIVTVFSLDTKKWDPFVNEFSSFVSLLSQKGMKNYLKNTPNWFNTIVDEDSNVDMVELLQRIPDFMKGDWEVKCKANNLLKMIAYPKGVAEVSSERMHISKKHVASFTLAIEADDYLQEAKLLAKSKEKWELNNQDILKQIPLAIRYSIQKIENKRYFTIQHNAVNEDFDIRPWLPGTRNIIYRYLDRKGRVHKKKLHREKDFVQVPEFPASSYLLSEAHTNGAPFIHGVGLMLEPELTKEDGHDPEKGPEFYKTIAWNQRTHWGDMILIGGKKKMDRQRISKRHMGRIGGGVAQ